jgi:hypothetical protein
MLASSYALMQQLTVAAAQSITIAYWFAPAETCLLHYDAHYAVLSQHHRDALRAMCGALMVLA